MIKITVLKRALHSDLAKTYARNPVRPCELFTDGQAFLTTGLSKPDGFCDYAWNDIQKNVIAIMSGGTFDRFGDAEGWMKNANQTIACCTDGLRPVTFAIDRINVVDVMDLSGAKDPAPRETYFSERWGVFAYSLPGLTAGRSYRIRLHFMENFFTRPGQRVFNVALNGKAVLENFDILSETGAMYVALVKEFDTVAGKDGAITVVFVRGTADQPKLSGLEVFELSSPSGKTGSRILALNAGGPAKGDYAADAHVQGGNIATAF